MRALRPALPTLKAVDAVVAGLLLVMIVISALVVARLPGAVPGRAGWSVLAGAVQTLPVLWRRERPLTALLVFCASAVPVAALVSALPVWTWSVLVFAVVRLRPPRVSVPAVAASTGVVLLLSGLAEEGTRLDGEVAGAAAGLAVVVVPVLLVAAALAVAARAADTRRTARRHREEGERLAAALAAQRERIAEDLRGLVAARVERVVVGTRRLPHDSPDDRSDTTPDADEDVDAALAAVGAEAREALAGMRRALGLLRAEEAPGPRDPETRAATPHPGGSWWPSRGGLVLAGLLVAVVVALALVVPLAPPGPWSPTLTLLDVDPARPWGLVAVAVQLLAVAWWRRAPLTALVVATAGSALSSSQGTTNLIAEASWGILVYAAGLGAPLVLSAVVVGATTLAVLGTTLVVGLPAGLPTTPLGLVLSYVLVPAVWGLGALQRRTAERADRRRAVQVAHDAERAVRAQRLGLARDLHDVLAHELSALVVSVHAARVDPAPAALLGVAEAGERIAAALPGLVGETVPREPATALDAAAVDGLAAGVREAALPVTVAVDGEPPPDHPEADLFAGRIVTEALTNVLRHAGPTPTRVQVRHDAGAVVVEVVDAGARPGHRPGGGSGLGLVGMRERAALLGGELEAGPHDGGWRVCARLPRRPAGETASHPA